MQFYAPAAYITHFTFTLGTGTCPPQGCGQMKNRTERYLVNSLSPDSVFLLENIEWVGEGGEFQDGQKGLGF